MIIGIDIRALQTGHKFRGIGEVAKQVTNRILPLAQNDGHTVIFYEYSDGNDPKKLLHMPKGLNYEVIKLGKQPENDKETTITQKLKRSFNDLYGHPIKDSKKSDIFLQFDYAFGVPKNTKTILIKHDLIPYIFWDRFFESAWIPFKNKAVRTTVRTLFANYRYKKILRRSLANAGLIMAVSDSTKNDVKRLFNVSDRKLKVAHLGVDVKPSMTNDTNKSVIMPAKPYLLFVGAGDERRRVEDAVHAFNNLKAAGRDIQLVLVGENFKSPEQIPNPTVRNAVIGSSYKKDILTLGYIDDETKQRLFKDAVAYVYPTKYEGFGIPVLESMLLGCPIIVYKNSSIPEVGGDHALYVKDWQGIKRQVEILLDQPPKTREKNIKAARKFAEQFTWDKTAEVIYDELLNTQ